MKALHFLRIALFVLLLACLIAGVIVLPDREFSENENRSLETFPVLSIDNIMDCSFQEDLEKYLSDQFPYRDHLMSNATKMLKLIGRTEINGAYVSDSGYDFERILDTDIRYDRIDKNIKSVRKFFESCKEFIPNEKLCFMLVPTSGYVYSDDMPEYAPMFDQIDIIRKAENDLSNYNVISVDEELKVTARHYDYYKTDHHWTSNGAYVASQKWAYNTDRVLRTRDYYDVSVVNDSFRGSLYSKVLDVDSAYDEIIKYEPVDSEYKYVLTANNGEVTMDGFYDESKLSVKDKYQYFLGGNYAELHIERVGETLSEDENNLLVVKDSFANAFVPFVAERFDNVYMIDLRYFRGDLTTYLADKGIDEVLILYNVSNFVSDANIYKLGEHDIVAPEVEVIEYPTIEVTPDLTLEYTSTGMAIVGDAGFEGYKLDSDNADAYAKTITNEAIMLDEIANVYDLVVPMACGITMPDEIAKKTENTNMQYAMQYIGSQMGDEVKFVNVYNNMMLHRDEYLYFRTDHHWTQLGAYYAYQVFCEKKGIPYKPLNSYETKVFDSFLGSLYNNSQNERMFENPDDVLVLYPHSNATMTVYPAEGDPFEWAIINDVSNYNNGVKYSTFIAGDNPFTVIHNNDLEDGSSIIVIKESYGNALVPLLVDHYENIYVIDYRYYQGSVSDIARQHAGNCDVLYINNVGMITSKFLVAKLTELQ